jgi:hypothetical protein
VNEISKKTAKLKNTTDPIITPNTIIHDRETQYTRFKHGYSNGFAWGKSDICAVFYSYNVKGLTT